MNLLAHHSAEHTIGASIAFSLAALTTVVVVMLYIARKARRGQDD